MDMQAFSAENRRRCESAAGFNHTLESWSISDWMTAILGELGEAANLAKKLNRVRDGIPGNTASPDELRAMFADELADIFIYTDLTTQTIIGRGVKPARASDRLFELFATKSDSLSKMISYAGVMFGGAADSALSAPLWAEMDNDPARNEERRQNIASRLDRLAGALQLIAEHVGVDFPSAIRDKFDSTSRKIGYPPLGEWRLELDGAPRAFTEN